MFFSKIKIIFNDLIELKNKDYISFKELTNKLLAYTFFIIITIFILLLLLNIFYINFNNLNYNMFNYNYEFISKKNILEFKKWLKFNHFFLYFSSFVLKILFNYIVFFITSHIFLFLNSFLQDYFKEYKLAIYLLFLTFSLIILSFFFNIFFNFNTYYYFYNFFIYIDFIYNIKNYF